MTSLDHPVEHRLFYCPQDTAIHPRAAEAERDAIAWMDHIGLWADDKQRRRLIGTNSAEFFSRFAPRAGDDGLQVAVRWVYWGFIFDDLRCDAGEFSTRPHEFLRMAGETQRALESPWHAVVDDPLALALQDIGRSMRECATPVQAQRFVHAHRSWLYAVAWQTANRAQGRMPGLDEYTIMRSNSAGGEPTLALLEIANGAEIPGAEMDSPPIRALTEMTILIASWDNDLHSHVKESREREAEQNIVNVLMHQYGVGESTAVDRARALRDRVMARFLQLRDTVLTRPCSPALREYLACLGHAIRGNIDWALNVPRYTAADGSPPTVPAPRAEATWTSDPCDVTAEPLPIPAITWWWDEL
ncbi:hypothetical protein AB0M48_25395 [Lentzea sp. NPDC051208]|uniref:terpene synthase family protein n=1 Tax=Lentzea sp. NPDC051208 TaxID=3154642 RepID=UPI003424C1E8